MKVTPLKIEDNNHVICDVKETTHLKIIMPGTNRELILPVSIYKEDCIIPWYWNGDVNKPTLHPSVKSTYFDGTEKVICHSWIIDGHVNYLADSTHNYVMKKMELEKVKENSDE